VGCYERGFGGERDVRERDLGRVWFCTESENWSTVAKHMRADNRVRSKQTKEKPERVRESSGSWTRRRRRWEEGAAAWRDRAAVAAGCRAGGATVFLQAANWKEEAAAAQVPQI
jgi:hypothetical protein